MEMLIIDKSVLDELMNRIETLKNKLDRLYAQSGISTQQWMDNQQACQLLNASKRTLQHLRDNGILPFTKIGAKVFYKPEDIEKLFSTGYVRSNKGYDVLNQHSSLNNQKLKWKIPSQGNL